MCSLCYILPSHTFCKDILSYISYCQSYFFLPQLGYQLRAITDKQTVDIAVENLEYQIMSMACPIFGEKSLVCHVSYKAVTQMSALFNFSDPISMSEKHNVWICHDE